MNYLLTNQETERLTFRVLEQSDFEEWMELFEDENVGMFLGLGKGKTRRELNEIWFEKCFARYDEDRGGMNVLVDKKSGKLIGQCGLLIQVVEGETRLEIGYSILPKYWGMGYATEAAKKHRDFAFEKNYWPELISTVHVDNIGSEKVAQKNGMTLEKIVLEDDGEYYKIFLITRKQWLELQEESPSAQ